MALEDRIKALTPEQRARAKQCKTAEEMLALAKEEGYELSDEQLDSIAGGKNWDGSQDYVYVLCLACKSKVSWKAEEAPPEDCPYCNSKLVVLG